MKFYEKVIKKLNEKHVDIAHHEKIDKNEYRIYIKEGIIICNEEDKDIYISFNINTKPDESAAFVLILREIEGLNGIIFMESFAIKVNKENNSFEYLSGKEAYNHLYETIGSSYVKEYENEKELMKYLIDCKGGTC